MQEDPRVPELARQVLQLLAAQLDEVGKRIGELDTQIMAWHKTNPVSRRLVTIPGSDR
jgi:transposase